MKIFLLLLSVLAGPLSAASVFRAGVSAIDISPTAFPRIIAGGFLEGRGDKLTDKLHVRSFVLDDGTMKIAFAIVDTCMMEQSLIDEAKALASKQCGIPVDRMMVSATHTHSAPAAMSCLGTRKDSEYAKLLTPKIAEGIVAADKALQPARIGWGSFDDWEHTHNRRWIRLAGKEVVDPFGQPTGRAHMHPGYLSKDVVGPSGPVDPQLSVISLQTLDGKPLGVLANYSQHYFGSGAVSSDYYGLFCKHLAAKMARKGDGNGAFVCAMSQGTSGDQMWMDYGAEKKSITLDAYASAVADSAMQTLKNVTYDTQVSLAMEETTLQLNYRVPDEKRLAWARPIAEKIVNDAPKDKQEVYAREALILHERQKTTVKLQAIRIGSDGIGELSIATLPNEVYALTGLQLRWHARHATHFNISLANGAEGYIPSAEQHVLGGYTTWPARTAGLEVAAEKTIRGVLGQMLDKVNPSRGRGMGHDAPPYTMAVIESRVALHLDFQHGTDFHPNEAKTVVSGGHALWLPGVGAGRGYGDESRLKTEVMAPPDKINRSIHLAGGHIETTGLNLGDKASVGVWFWLGHESGASERTGTLIEAFGASLQAHQFADHTVQLEWSGSDTAAPHTQTIFADDWHFAVLIRDGDQLRVHLDGDENPALTGKAGRAGAKLVYGRNLQGKLDEIVVWDHVIEPSLIAKLWKILPTAEENARHATAPQKKTEQAQMQTSTLLKQHENWSASTRFRNTKASNVSPVTAYLISRGPKGDHQAPGDHLGIGGNHKDSLPGRLFVFNGNAAGQIVRGSTLIEPGTWNEVKLERLGARVKVTLNGKTEIDAELPVTAAGAKELFFGRRCDDFAPLEGEFADVAVSGLERPAATAPTPTPKLQLSSQPLSPGESAKKWHVREGYEVKLAAAEPVVLDPVAFDWDVEGRLWVVEMADYPLGMDGKGKAGGRVVMVEDTNADDRYDKRTVIAEGLNFPTGILTWRDGAIVTAAPDILFLKPGGEKKVLFTGFSTGNQQLRVNGLRWGMDGWVYCAAGAHNGGYNKGTQIESKLTGEKIDLGSRDFRFKPDTGEFDPQSGPSQFGRARDDWGNWFGVQNSFPLWHYVLQDHYLLRNPHVIPPDPIHQLFPRNPPVYPASSMEKRFHSFDQSGRFTSACGIEIYRDKVLFDDTKTHAFTCEPFHNVVQHNVLEEDGVIFKAVRDPAESKMDFLASEDRWCRPVMVRTGPDGALWVADMYRYMIEHPQWLPQNGKDELLPHYREGDDKGRIWRVVRSGTNIPSVGSTLQSANKSVRAAFESSNGWIRDKAQMQCLWNKAGGLTIADLSDVVFNTKTPIVQTQAIWTLHQNTTLPPLHLQLLLLNDDDNAVIQGLQIAETMPWETNEEALMLLVSGNQFSHPRVWMQFVLSAGHWKGDWPADIVAAAIHEAEINSPLSGAAFSSCLPHLTRICDQFSDYEGDIPPGIMGALLRCAMGEKNEAAVAAVIAGAKDQPKIAEVLAVLEEKGLSLADFAKQASSPQAQQGLRRITDTLTKVAEAVKSAQENPPIAALALLASDRQHRDMVTALLPQIWAKSGNSDVLRLAARLQPQEGPDFLTVDWSTKTPATRTQIVEALLSSDAWTLALLEKIKTRQIDANALDAATRARLMKHPKKEVQKLAATLLADSTSATRAAVVEKFKPTLKMTGNPAQGKTMFAQVCISCHKLDGVGLDLGPDLRSVAQHDAEKLLNSILDPSAIIEPGFTAYHCTLKNGEQLYGVVATETSASLTLKMAGNLTRSVLRSDIASLKSTGTSLMPEGLEAALTPQSLADLIAYLKMTR
ncbi:MAG TPA: PVC-type heme-binding CxxCH protein [Prosthecobacter sp.]